MTLRIFHGLSGLAAGGGGGGGPSFPSLSATVYGRWDADNVTMGTGVEVASFTDLSSFGHDLPNTANQSASALNTADINGYNSVSLSDAQYAKTSSVTLPSHTSFSIAVVIKSNGWQGVTLGMGVNSSGNGFGIATPGNFTADRVGALVGGTAWIQTDASGFISTTAYHLVIVTLSGGTITWYVDGTACTPTSSTVPSAFSTARIDLATLGASNIWKGKFAAGLITDALGSTDRASVTSYYQTKYGI